MKSLLLFVVSILIANISFAAPLIKSKNQPRKVNSSKNSTVRTYKYTSKTSTSTDTDTQVKK